MTKRILVLHTGGTISMQADTTGKVITTEHNPNVGDTGTTVFTTLHDRISDS